MLSGDQCSGVSELAEGHTFIRGRCKQLGNLYSPNRDDGRCFSNSEHEFLLPTDEFGSPVDVIEKQPEDICRRVSMTPGDINNEHEIQTPTNENPTSLIACSTSDRRSSRDIGVQAFSLEIEEEKTKTSTSQTEHQSQQNHHHQQQQQQQQYEQHHHHQHHNHPPPLKVAEASRKECHKCSLNESHFVQHDHRPSILLRRDSCHYHKIISPRNEIFVAHCPGSTPLLEFAEGFDTYKSHTDGATTSIDMSNKDIRKQCYCLDHNHESMDSNDTVLAHQYSTASSDDSTLTKIAVENAEGGIPSTSRRPSTKWRQSLVYFMDPCIEDSIETAPEEEYNEKEQTKPLLENHEMRNAPTISTTYENRQSLRKSIDEPKGRTADSTAVRNVEGIELASDAVCPFGLAKNLEKQICIIPSRKKKSSGRPSFLKCVTLILIGSAILITSAAIKEAYY